MNIAYPPELGNPTPPSARIVRQQAVAAVIALLAELYPRCFSIYEGRRRPLKIGIHKDIQAKLDGAITADELYKALGAYCSNPVYLSSTRKGAWRLDLDGKPAGVVTADEEAHAKAILASIRAKQEARTAAGKAQAKPTTPQPTKRPAGNERQKNLMRVGLIKSKDVFIRRK